MGSRLCLGQGEQCGFNFQLVLIKTIINTVCRSKLWGTFTCKIMFTKKIKTMHILIYAKLLYWISFYKELYFTSHQDVYVSLFVVFLIYGQSFIHVFSFLIWTIFEKAILLHFKLIFLDISIVLMIFSCSTSIICRWNIFSLLSTQLNHFKDHF